ncbi:MAG: M48 family metalloprotease [Pirellulaceae bacterium]
MTDVLQFKCPGCGRGLRVRDSAAGKVIQCPGCGKKLRVPTRKPVQPSSSIPKQRATESIAPLEKPAPKEPPTRPMVPSGVNEVDHASFEFPAATASSGPAVDDLFATDLPATASRFPGFTPAAFASPMSPLSSQGRPKVDLGGRIREQLSEKMPRHRVGLGYRCGLTFTAAFMLMLPIAYVGLIVASGYGMYYYMFEVLPSLMDALPRGRVAAIALVMYVTPLIAGLAVVLFMIKPVFVAVIAPDAWRQRSLRREGEPLLFELVDRICDVTGAPKPSRIDVESNVNASAAFGQGLRGLIGSNLVLTIGVPLLSGLTVRQFAGVLAHEFGHFSQGAGMRASFVIRSVNFWLVRAVYHRDAIDHTLDEWIEDSESWLVIPLLVAKLFGWITRRILWFFMIAGHLGSCFLLRQMEFDADRYETHIGGSQSFAATSDSMRILEFAQYQSMQVVGHLLRDGVLIDNIPRVAELMKNRMSKEVQQEIVAGFRQQPTSWWDTHPSDSDRIAASSAIDSEGVLKLDQPARELVSQYDSLCKNVTLDFYRNQLGRLINPTELEPTENHLHRVIAGKP